MRSFWVVAASVCSAWCLAAQANQCNPHLVRDANPSSRVSFSEYPFRNDRSLLGEGTFTYEGLLGVDLTKKIGEGQIALDLGGGKGTAFAELGRATGATVIVVNPQDPVLRYPADCSFTYLRGYAEEVLPGFVGKARLITDVWGAFSYSIYKAEILELIYNALEVGGTAYVYYSSLQKPVTVNQIDLTQYLETYFSKVFRISKSPASKVSRVIVIRKREPGVLRLGLQLRGHRLSRDDAMGWPEVWYGF